MSSLQNLNVRRCSHCRRIGHNVNVCNRAQADGFVIHQNILASIFRQRIVNNQDSIKLILSNYTLHQLKILMGVLHLVGPRATFIPTLYSYRIISINNTFLRIKEDHIIVLMYYYLHHPSPTNNQPLLDDPIKLDIQSFLQEMPFDNSVPFDCPICMESKEWVEKVICNCNHEICKTCMDNYLKHFVAKNNPPAIKPGCSLCRTSITSITLHNQSYLQELNTKYF